MLRHRRGVRRRRKPELTRRHMTMRVRALPDVGEGIVEAYASVYDVEYQIGWGFRERIRPGAFDDSIAARSTLPTFWEHDWSAGPIGTGETSSDDKGVKTITQLYVDDPMVRRVWRSMADGAIVEWSIAFYPTTISTDPDDPYLDIVERGELIECSVCVVGANPETETVDVRSRRGPRRRTDSDEDPAALAAAIDATLDQIAAALAGGDTDTATALVTAAEATADSLLDALGVDDADDSDEGDETRQDAAMTDAQWAALANPVLRAAMAGPAGV